MLCFNLDITGGCNRSSVFLFFSAMSGLSCIIIDIKMSGIIHHITKLLICCEKI